MNPRSRIWMTLIAATAVAGCMSSGDEPGEESGGGGSHGRPGVTSTPSALLFQAEDCDDLLGHIQDDVITKVYAQASLLKRGEEFAFNGGGGLLGGPVSTGTRGVAQADFGNTTMNAAPPIGAPAPGAADPAEGQGMAAAGGGAAPAPVPQPPSIDGDDNSGGAAGAAGGEGSVTTGPTDFSETNTQVEGVDEADIVKTDGQRIYVLHGRHLFILDAWPANEASIEVQGELEGDPIEMFLHGDRVVVFSRVYDQGDLIDPKSDPDQGDDIATTQPACFDCFYDPYPYYGSPFVKVTVVDATPGQDPSVERELYFEGNYLSARRHDDSVRAVVQGGFRVPPIFNAYIEYRDAFGREFPQEEIDAQVDAWRDRTIASIEMTDLDDWLPTERERIAGELTTPERRCTDFYAPAPGMTGYGMTNIISFDVADPQSALGGAIVLGAADEVYASRDAMVLAHRDYRFDAGWLEKEQTALHLFELSPEATAYVASGLVPGHILDQFSIDESEGTVRVTTSQRIWQDFIDIMPLTLPGEEQADTGSDREQTDNRVITLQADGTSLRRVGISEPLGEDGETIYSTRFVDDMAYVVTFRQTDPLMAVDVSDPEMPTLLGELHIPGFSEYMHPLGPNHLLTIGRDTDAGGRDIGQLLQIFDVSDPTAPARVHTFAYTVPGYSEANSNHKAFTFHQPAGYGEGEGLLAFPFVNYGYPFASTLEVFEVSTTDGFEQLGSIDHTQLLTGTCSPYGDGFMGDIWVDDIYYYCNQPEVRRGLFIFDEPSDSAFVYSISYGGMLVHDMDGMVEVANVSLPPPDYGYGFPGDVAVGGVAPPLPPVMTQPAPAGSGAEPAPGVGGAPAPEPEPPVDGGVPMEPEDAGSSI